MFTWIIENIATIVICLVLHFDRRRHYLQHGADKKKGKSSCGGGCQGCPMSGSCHKH